MSRVHLGMKRPIRQFEKSYKKLLELIEYFEEEPITTEVQKEIRIQMLKERFNDCLIQLNNIKNTQIDYLKENGEQEMNEEIQEILNDLQDEDCYWLDCERKNTSLTYEEAHLLLNYIFNLQNRIDKAIEYIEKNSKQCLTNKIDEQPTKVIGKFMWNIDDLLDILKESGE